MVEPPQLPAALAPASHCGMGATAQLPAWSGAPLMTVFAPQTAETQLHSSPLLAPLFHSSVKVG